MKPPAFAYRAPVSLDEAVEDLAEHAGETMIIAGGQSLMPMLNLRLVAPARLLDVMRILELQRFSHDDDVVEVGAGVRQAAAERGIKLAILRKALRHVGHPATRNAGTICGSLAYANPGAELPAVAVALDAEIVLRSRRGVRTLTATDFFRGPFTTACAPDELVTAVRFPVPGGRTAIAEMTPRMGGSKGDAAVAGAVAVQHSDSIAIALFGVGEVPVRARRAEAVLAGQQPCPELHREAADVAVADLDPPSDVHMGGAHRKRLVRVLIQRVLDEVNQ